MAHQHSANNNNNRNNIIIIILQGSFALEYPFTKLYQHCVAPNDRTIRGQRGLIVVPEQSLQVLRN
jgi:hypothetical protein